MDRDTARTLGRYILAASLVVALLPHLIGIVGVPGEGRYQIGGTDAGKFLMIDTRTGRTWSRMVSVSSGPASWHEDEAAWSGASGR